ncbi:MAG: DUF3426 domain-containing protein [Actinomycetota bacterium]
MLISCPNCSTSFSIPDKALGDKGRTLKCAKCGHKWFQAPIQADDLDLDLAGPSITPTPAASAREEIEPRYEEPAPAPSPPRGRDDDFDLDIEQPPIPDFGERAAPERPDHVSSLLDDEPEPIPEVFARPAQPAKSGTAGLWVLLLLLLLGGAGGAAFYFQDRLVEIVPEAGDVLGQMGLRREKPGAGLQLRSAGTPERFVHNDTEVLIVRGIIANVSERPRPVPMMKLVLLDKDKTVVQEKQSQPPVTMLDPQGTASFKIMLERPNPNAVEVNVVFVETAPAPTEGK